ncbi:MAG: KamA family radical SAM protein [Candidatus Margulisbacteria bacterium]|nr:KamA family radical SAM protein [Candidatus Margulisiibacteriota bacterium]
MKPRNIKVSEWKDWNWQLNNSIRTLEQFEKFTGIGLNKQEKQNFPKVVKSYPFCVTPYYLSLINKQEYSADPVFRQCFPDIAELKKHRTDGPDPLAELDYVPVKGIIHRYPDRVLFYFSNLCPANCRHCSRKNKIGKKEFTLNAGDIQKAVQYIAGNKTIREVIFSGGEPLVQGDDLLNNIFANIRKIAHVEIIRIGSRMPVVLPFRITDKLLKILKKYKPLWFNTHFNHPQELTENAANALAMLADAGIPLGNQTVLLKGINDDSRTISELNRKLIKNRVRPYYLYQCDMTSGTNHFRTPLKTGRQIVRQLAVEVSGLAIPDFVIDTKEGKIRYNN